MPEDGLDPAAMVTLRGRMLQARDELGARRRAIEAIFAEVGEHSDVPAEIRQIEEWLSEQQEDLRRRIELAQRADRQRPESGAVLGIPTNRWERAVRANPLYDPTKTGWTPKNLPRVDDPALNRLLREMYRPTSQLGSGSTADALRDEITRQVRNSNRGHYTKIIERINQLEKLQRGAQTPRDAAATRAVLRDLYHVRDMAQQAARARGLTVQQMLDSFPRAPRPAPSRWARIGAFVRGVVGRLSTPVIVLNPCGIDKRAFCERSDGRDLVA